MKNKEVLDRLFDQFFHKAKKNLQKEGSLHQCVFLLTGSKDQPKIAGVVEMKFKTENDKNRIAKGIEEIIKTTGCWGYVMVNEVWLLASDDFTGGKMPHGARPSQHSKRREAVWVALFTYDYHRGGAAIFERKGKKIRFTTEVPIETDTEFAGRFAEMLPPMN